MARRRTHRKKEDKDKSSGGAEANGIKDGKAAHKILSDSQAPLRRVLMNVLDSEQLRVAIAGPGGLEELYIERSSNDFSHGNIYKGKVQNIEPALQAAFVDIGGEKNGFLHANDVIAPFGGYDDVLKRRKRKEKRSGGRPSIEDMLYKGQEVLVQITREQLATKGPSLTTYISLPGRYLVLMPAVSKRGVSKKITDDRERQSLKAILDQLEPPQDMGYIIRTAGMGHGRDELEKDLQCLTRLWDAIKEQARRSKPPVALYQESDLVVRAIRDFVYDDVEEIVIDSQTGFDQAINFLNAFMPEFTDRLFLYQDVEPIFDRYGVETAIEKTLDRSVRLPSGGEVIIEQTEALVAIDVNTGRFRKGDSTRETILAMNKEAAAEVARQLRLRDLGGLVMIDFIDMESGQDRRVVEEAFRAAARRDRARTTILPISQLGVMEMTRQRLRQSVKKTLYTPCPCCDGTGIRKSVEVLGLELLRKIRAALDERRGALTVRMHPDAALALANAKRSALAEIEEEMESTITIVSDSGLQYADIVLDYADRD
ncbi:MAG: Rne/Rng family ribonuclease [Planctomycetes bacterium]|nr:Rne/Rng family ribonuclease [Planctomycetota bacterium]